MGKLSVALTLIAAIVGGSSVALAQEVKKEIINPWKWQDQFFFSQGIKVMGGSLLFLAGQGGIKANGQFFIPTKFEEQVKLTFDNMETILKAAGGTLDDIVYMTVHVTDMRFGRVFTSMRKDYFKKGYPASTLVESPHLALPEMQIEITAIAVVR